MDKKEHIIYRPCVSCDVRVVIDTDEYKYYKREILCIRCNAIEDKEIKREIKNQQDKQNLFTAKNE